MWEGTYVGWEDDRGEELEEIGAKIQPGVVYTCMRLNC